MELKEIKDLRKLSPNSVTNIIILFDKLKKFDGLDDSFYKSDIITDDGDETIFLFKIIGREIRVKFDYSMGVKYSCVLKYNEREYKIRTDGFFLNEKRINNPLDLLYFISENIKHAELTNIRLSDYSRIPTYEILKDRAFCIDSQFRHAYNGFCFDILYFFTTDKIPEVEFTGARSVSIYFKFKDFNTIVYMTKDFMYKEDKYNDFGMLEMDSLKRISDPSKEHDYYVDPIEYVNSKVEELSKRIKQ